MNKYVKEFMSLLDIEYEVAHDLYNRHFVFTDDYHREPVEITSSIRDFIDAINYLKKYGLILTGKQAETFLMNLYTPFYQKREL